MTDKVKKMIDGFMYHHNRGKSIQEIAEIFGVTTRTVYANLHIIAQNNNIASRAELLQQPHKLSQQSVKSQLHPKTENKGGQNLVSQNDNTFLMYEDNHSINEGLCHETQTEEIQKLELLGLLEDYQKEEERVNELLKFINEIMLRNRRL